MNIDLILIRFSLAVYQLKQCFFFNLRLKLGLCVKLNEGFSSHAKICCLSNAEKFFNLILPMKNIFVVEKDCIFKYEQTNINEILNIFSLFDTRVPTGIIVRKNYYLQVSSTSKNMEGIITSFLEKILFNLIIIAYCPWV